MVLTTERDDYTIIEGDEITCRDSGDPAIFSAASRRARLALISPSATITLQDRH